MSTTFRVWLRQKPFRHKQHPDWDQNGATIAHYGSIAADGWDVTVSAGAEMFETWLEFLKKMGWVFSYHKQQEKPKRTKN
jgi:hypothetical protein